MNATLQALLAQNPGLILQALQSQPASAETGEAAGPIEGYALYDPAKTAYGQSFQRYDPQGAFVGEGQFKKPGNALQMTGQFAKDMAPLALAALGANALGAGLGQGSIFSGGGLLGGGGAGSLTSGVTPGSVASFEAGLPSAAGVGSLTAGITPGAVAALEAGLPAAGAGTLAGAGGLGSLAGGMSGKVIGGLLGAAAGAANSGDKTQTSQQRLDPRMEAMLYGADGKGGYLGAATDWFNQNKGGNPLMLQGAQMMADFYRSPQYTEGYNSLRSAGLGLLNTPMAGNPFLRG